MTSNPQAISTLHESGLYREQAAIVAVYVSCGNDGRVGLPVQDAKGCAAILMMLDEAAHVAALLRELVAKLQDPGSAGE